VGASQPPKKGSKAGKPGEIGEFDTALAEQGAAAPIPTKPLDVKGPVQAEAAAAGSVPAQAGVQLRVTNAERNPLTLQKAVSLNTAAAITGPKPWDRDWVFTGNEQDNPELKTLIQNSQTPAPAGKDLAKMMEALTALRQANSQAESKGSGAAPIEAAPAANVGTAQVSALSQLDPLAQAMAAEMGGEVLSVEGTGEGTGRELSRGAHSQAGRLTLAQGGMSGTEFVNALNGAQGQSTGNGGEGASGGQAGRGKGQELLLASSSGELGARGARRGGVNPLDEKPSMITPRDSIAPNVLAMHSGVVKNETAQNLGLAAGPQTVTGHVVKGRMSTDRLSSQSLMGLATGIHGMSSQGGGEMIVKMNPRNLGELHVRVLTRGNQVGLEIRASNDSAKAIIEESMGHLRESLAGQNLSLAKIDLVVAQAAHSSQSGSDSSQWGQGSQQWNSDSQGARDSFGSGSGQNRNGERSESSASDHSNRASAPLTLRSGLSSMSQVAGSSSMGSRRLDVMA